MSVSQQNELLQQKSKQLSVEQLMVSLSLGHQIKKQMQNIEREGHSESDVWRMGKMFQLLLSDQKLYLNKSLQNLLKQSKNGWVSIQEILSIQSIKPIFRQIDLFKLIEKDLGKDLMIKFLNIHFKNNKSYLKTNKKSIKRRQSFIDKCKNVKPLLIENFVFDKEMKTIKQVLKNISEVYKIKWNLNTQSAYVYVQKPQDVIEFFKSQKNYQIQQLKTQKCHMKKITVESYESLLDKKSGFEEIEDYYFQKELSRSYLHDFIESQISQLVDNQIQDKDIIKNIEKQIFLEPQIIDRQQQNQIQNAYFEVYERNEQQMMMYQQMRQDEQRLNNGRQNERNLRSRNLFRKRQKQKSQLIIKKIMKKLFTYYRPNFTFNQQFLKISQKSQEIDKQYAENSPSSLVQNQKLIDSILQQRLTKILLI